MSSEIKNKMSKSRTGKGSWTVVDYEELEDEILEILKSNPRASQNYIASQVGRHYTVIAKILVRLKQKGLIPELNDIKIEAPIVKENSYLRYKFNPKEEPLIRLVPLGDMHIGAAEGLVDTAALTGTVKYILDRPDTYVIGTGDYWDGAPHQGKNYPSAYEASLIPQDQYLAVLDLLKPLAKEKKILGLGPGNHDSWIKDESGIDKVGDLCRELNVPLLGDGALLDIHVNDYKYTAYTRHGHGGSSTAGGMVSTMMRQNQNIVADLYIQGHNHQVFSMKGAHLINGVPRKCYWVMAGTFLRWEKTYAQRWGLSPGTTGVSKIKLFGDRWDIHVSI